jgi:hypothetical protein
MIQRWLHVPWFIAMTALVVFAVATGRTPWAYKWVGHLSVIEVRWRLPICGMSLWIVACARGRVR